MQYSFRSLVLWIAVFAVCIALAGRIRKSGLVIIGAQNRYQLESMLGARRISSYELIESSGVARVFFPNPAELTSVEDAIVKDAERRGYSVIIEYRKTVNAELGPPWGITQPSEDEFHGFPLS
jgi:hypothetical protein